MEKTIYRKFFQSILTVFLLLLVPPILLIIAILLPIRLIISLAAKKFHPELDGLLTGLTAAVNCYPSVNIVYVIFIDGEISTKRLETLLEENIFSLRAPNGELLYKRLKNTSTTYWGFPFWKKDEHFNLENHVREYDYEGDLTLPFNCTEEDVRGVVSGLLGAPWKNDRSPWEVLIIPTAENNKKPGTLCIVRHHHIIADGYSITGFFKNLSQTEILLPQPKAAYAKKIALSAILKIPYDFAGIFIDNWDSQTQWHFPTDGTPREYYTSKFISLPVASIKRAKDKVGVSYASLLFSIVGGGIQKILEEAKMDIPEYLTNYTPIPRPNHPGGLTNHVNMCPFQWNIRAESSTERAHKIQEIFTKMSQSLATGLLFLPSDLVGFMPYYFQNLLANSLVSGGSLLTTSFPVSEKPGYFDKKLVRRFYAAFGPPGNTVGTTILMGGINGEQGIVMNMDKRIFPSEKIFNRFGEYVDQELRGLL